MILFFSLLNIMGKSKKNAQKEGKKKSKMFKGIFLHIFTIFPSYIQRMKSREALKAMLKVILQKAFITALQKRELKLKALLLQSFQLDLLYSTNKRS